MNESTDTPQQPGPPGGAAGPAGSAAGTAPPLPPPEPPVHRPPLRRSVSDRKIAGVAGGLGRYFDVDPLIFRVVLVTLAIFGGSGLLLYAIGWLLIPEDGHDESEASRLVNGRATSKVVGALILAVVGLIAVGNFAHTGFGFGGFAALLAIAAAVYLITRGDMGWRPNQPPRPAGPPAPGQPAAPSAPYAAAPSAPYAAAPSAPYAAGPSAPFVASPYPAPAAGAYGQTPGTAYAAPGTAPPPAPPAWAPPPPKPREPRSVLGRVTISLTLLVAGVLVAWNIATDHDVSTEIVLASCLAVVGLGLVVGTFVGRARGLIVAGALLAVATSVASFTHVGFRGGVGERTWAPTTVAAVTEHSPYRLGVGSARLDLSNLDLSGRTLHVQVRQGVGDLTVIVPQDVTVRVDADVRAGAFDVLSAPQQNGTDLHERVVDPQGAGAPVLVIDAQLGVGDLEVRRATT
ncbi:MAG: PspC domain-containing protein [Actinomycetes bacterium]